MLIILNMRRAIPGRLKDQLMAANRHTCCICNEPRHPVEKHHINGDPGDNAWDNLAVLCRNCHGLVTAKGALGSRYTTGEVVLYKRSWEKRCADAGEEELDCPLEELYETKKIRGEEHEEYPFDMEEGDELVFSIDATKPVDAAICDDADIDEWADGDEDADDEYPLPPNYWHRTEIVEGEYKFVAPEKGRYVLLLVNWDDEPLEVTVDAAVWEDEE